MLSRCPSRANSVKRRDCSVYFENSIFAFSLTLISNMAQKDASKRTKNSWNRFPIKFWLGNDTHTRFLGLKQLEIHSNRQNSLNPEKIQCFVKKNSNSAKTDSFKKLKTCCLYQLSWSGQHVFIFLEKVDFGRVWVFFNGYRSMIVN